MDQISVEQNDQLKKWSSDRDAIVADLHINTQKNSQLISENKTLSEENKQLHFENDSFKKLLDQKSFIESEIRRLTPINNNLEIINRNLNETILFNQDSINFKSWVGQRDAILVEISNLREENKKLSEENISFSDSNTEISDKIKKSEGKLEELIKKEEEFSTLIKSDNAVLKVEKSELQTTNQGLKTENNLLEEKKKGLLMDIANLSSIHENIYEKTNGLESLVGGIVKVSSDNATVINRMFESAATNLQKVIDIGEKNVDKTNKLVLDIPKIIVDLHRDVVERRRISRIRPK